MDKIRATKKEIEEIYDIIPDIEEKETKEDGKKEYDETISFEDYTESVDEKEVLDI